MTLTYTDHFTEFKQMLEKSMLNKMQKAVMVVRNETVQTLSGGRSGRTYYVPGTHKKYTASAPGEAPASATGHLRQNVKTEVETNSESVIGYVGTEDDYGAILEMGTRHILPRPWLRPSFEKAEERVKEILGESIT
jgi:HK97 gp10 family phage protein